MGIETLLAVGMGASAGLSAIGSISQGYASQQQANYNASVAEANAQAARQQAALDEQTSRRQSAMTLGTIRARAAANTGDVGGSALDVLGDSAAEAELQALILRYGGEVKARGFESEAALNRVRGANAVSAGYIGAGTALLQAGRYAYGAYGGAPSAGGSVIPPLAATVPRVGSSGRLIGPV